MSNTLDMLLKADINKVKRPEKEVEITRLSEVVGQPVIFKMRALSPDEVDEIQEMAIDMKSGDIDVGKLRVHGVLYSVVEPDLKNKDLQKHFNSSSPKDLLKTMLLAGEIDHLWSTSQELSGYGDKAVRKVKN